MVVLQREAEDIGPGGGEALDPQVPLMVPDPPQKSAFIEMEPFVERTLQAPDVEVQAQPAYGQVGRRQAGDPTEFGPDFA